MYLNNHTVSGNVGKDGGTLRDAGDTKVLSFSIANTSPFGKKLTTWYRVSLFGRQAESIAPFIEKGTPVVIVGETYLETYNDKEGNERQSLAIRASTVQLAGARGDASTDNTTAEGDDIF